MAEVQHDIVDAGAQVLWVLQQDASYQDGTAARCDDTIGKLGGELGWCVGDAETEPEPNAFADSPFTVGRGFDMIVARRSMQVLWASSHGSPSGNDNPTGQEVLEAVRAAADAL